MENQTDHDLLIRLDEKVDGLHKKIDTIKDDHENRIRSLEKKVWSLSAVASLLGAVGGIAIRSFFKV